MKEQIKELPPGDLSGQRKASPQIPSKQSSTFHFHATIIGRKQPYFQSHEDETIGLSYIIQCQLTIPLDLMELRGEIEGPEVWRIQKTQNQFAHLLEQLEAEYAFLPVSGPSLQRSTTERHWHETMNVQRMLQQVLYCLTHRKDTLHNHALLCFLNVRDIDSFLQALKGSYGTHFIPRTLLQEKENIANASLSGFVYLTSPFRFTLVRGYSQKQNKSKLKDSLSHFLNLFSKEMNGLMTVWLPEDQTAENETYIRLIQKLYTKRVTTLCHQKPNYILVGFDDGKLLIVTVSLKELISGGEEEENISMETTLSMREQSVLRIYEGPILALDCMQSQEAVAVNDEGSILLIRCDQTKVALGGSVKKRLEAKSLKGGKAMVVTCMCTFPEKNFIFLGTSENTIFALKYQRNENKISMKEQISLWSKYKSVSCISFLNAGESQRLVAAAGDETYVWQFNRKNKESKLIEIYSPYIVKEILPHGSESIDSKQYISAVKILEGRNIMAVGYSTGVLMLWDLLRREFITALLFHNEMIMGIYYDEESETVLSYSQDGVIKMWKI